MFGLFQKTKDPVCKMNVDKNKIKHFSEYKGVRYYFCSENCKEDFGKDPEKYTALKKSASTHSCCS